MESYRIFGNFAILKQMFRMPDFQENATHNLLKSSVLIAFSGALRVYIAAILLRIHPNMVTCLAGGLIIYSVYTLDRTVGSEEDSINRKELNDSRKEIGLAASMLTFAIGSYVLTKEGMLALAFLPFITGFLYSKGIKIGKFILKLKAGLGVKNFVVGLTWGAFISGLAGSNCKSFLPIALVFILYGVKTFVNSTIDDFKDIKGDTLAGIKTLPICLGDQNTRNFLLGLHVLSHLILCIALVKGIVAFEPLIIVCSFICGSICIQNYTNEEKYLSRKLELAFFKDGESTVTLMLRVIASSYLG